MAGADVVDGDPQPSACRAGDDPARAPSRFVDWLALGHFQNDLRQSGSANSVEDVAHVLSTMDSSEKCAAVRLKRSYSPGVGRWRRRPRGTPRRISARVTSMMRPLDSSSWNEGAGRRDRAVRLAPPHKHLGAQQPAGGDVDDGLIVGDEVRRRSSARAISDDRVAAPPPNDQQSPGSGGHGNPPLAIVPSATSRIRIAATALGAT